MKTTTQNALPHSAPRAEPEQRENSRSARSLWLIARHCIQRVLAVAWCEILLLARSIVSWVMLAAFTLLTVLYARSQVSVPSVYINNGDAIVAICAYAASFIFFLLPFLHANTFARDRQRRVHQLVWTRPLASMEYALGKGLGAICISLLLSWLPLIAGWLTASIARGQMQPLDLWLPMLLVVGAGTVLITCCTLLLISLMPSVGFLGALVTAGVVVYVDVIFAKSMLFLRNLTAVTLFISPSIGFGPDGNLLFWQRASYVMGGLVCLSLLLLVYQIRERLGVVQIRHMLSTALLIILTGALLFMSISTYQTVGAGYTDAGILTAKPVQAVTSNYAISVTANPTSGEVQGTASFTLTPRGALESDFIIGLNPGLHVHQVEAQSTTSGNIQALSFHETPPGWTTINVRGTSLGNNQPANISIVYSGQMILGRGDYRAATGGYGRANGISWTQNFFYLSFLGQGAGELLGAAGSWYPLPFTQQALDAGERVPVDKLDLRFPSSFKVWSSLGNLMPTSDGKWQELVAHPHASLPVALAAALSHAQQDSTDGHSFWHQGDAPDQTQLLIYRLTIQEVQALNSWLAPTSTPASFQTVIVPILPFPVISPGLLLVPETIGSNGLDPMNGSPYTTTALARYTAWQLARSWWLNAAWFPFAQLTGEFDTQNLNSSTSIQPTNALLNMLSAYSAVVITDKVIGSNFFVNEMQLCTQVFNSSGQYSQQEQVLQNKMTAMGTTCIASELVPFRLQLIPTVGFASLTNFLQHYALAHIQQKTDMRQFLQQAGVLAGKNITAEAAPYICPSTGKDTPSSTANDPLACLNGMYSGT